MTRKMEFFPDSPTLNITYIWHFDSTTEKKESVPYIQQSFTMHSQKIGEDSNIYRKSEDRTKMQ